MALDFCFAALNTRDRLSGGMDVIIDLLSG